MVRKIRTHEGRCSSHPDLGDVSALCDGTCLNEPCDDCLADSGEECSGACPSI